MNETILASGRATADNLAAQMAMIMFAARAPDVAMLKKIYAVLDRNAGAAAAAAHCGESAIGFEIEAGPRQSRHGRDPPIATSNRLVRRSMVRRPSPGPRRCSRNSASNRWRRHLPMKLSQLIPPPESNAGCASGSAWQTHYTPTTTDRHGMVCPDGALLYR
ncbi:MAG: hypothetical protein IPK59_23075 [Rhodospirillaceae bacterium]|nr:hypothetical protein [Rhodospirillaceae bacterium]